MKPQDIIRALEQVPEKRLLILELVRQCIGEDGQFQLELAIPLAGEVEAACQEARAYTTETERLRWALDKLTRDQ